MAHLWIQAENTWSVLPCNGDAFELVSGGAPFVRRINDNAHHASPRLLRQPTPADRESWALLAPPGQVRVNGEPLALGLRALQDKDEIQLAGLQPMFFSTERQALIEPFPDAPKPVCCPRCRDVIASGALSVKCPACGIWHHQMPERPCWSYAPTCSLCDQSTDLSAGFRWSPEAL